LRQGVEELKGEVESLGKLSHENVVQICGMTEGPEPNGTQAWQMALEFCESDAMKLLYDKDDEVFASYGLELMVDLAQQILQGLCYIHGEGVTHLDLKPENVLLTKNEEGGWVAKLADFGMAYTDDSTDIYTAEAQQAGSSSPADGSERFSASGADDDAKLKAGGEANGQDLRAALDTVKPYGTWEYMAVRCLAVCCCTLDLYFSVLLCSLLDR
jgi:serine/threonine protein kinase